MIFYFSGTGNTKWTATEIAMSQETNLISISQAVKEHPITYQLEKNEIVGFVYPIYGWGPPNFVLDFVKALDLQGYSYQYTFAISSCGACEGYAYRILRKKLKKRGYHLDSAFSVAMPSNNIILHNTLKS